MIVVIFDVNVIFYDFCDNKIMYMYVIVYLLLFVFANELLIIALWRANKKGKKGPANCATEGIYGDTT